MAFYLCGIGDGNCLMHAVILATCGLQDCGMVLRRLVYFALVDASANTFRERWKKERERLNELIPGGVQMSSEVSYCLQNCIAFRKT